MVRKTLDEIYWATGVKEAMDKRYITLSELAQGLRMDKSNLSRIVNARTVASLMTATRFAEYFDVPVSALFTRVPLEGESISE